MRGSIKIEGKTWYLYETGTKRKCQGIAKMLRKQSGRARVFKLGGTYTGRYGVYLLSRLKPRS